MTRRIDRFGVMLRGLLLHSEKIDSVIRRSRPASRRCGCSGKNKFGCLSSGNRSMEITAALFRQGLAGSCKLDEALLSRFSRPTTAEANQRPDCNGG